MKASEIVPGGRIVALIKGPPKTGKTLAACSFPKPLLLSLDGRVAPLRTFAPLKDRLENIEYEVFTDFPKLDKRLDELERNCPYETLIFDNLTFGGGMIVSYAMDIGGGDTKGRKKGIISLPTIEDWQAESEAIRQIMEILMVIPCHIVMIAHVQTKIFSSLDGKTQKIIQSLVSGMQKTGSIVTGFFDEVYHFEKESNIIVGGKPKYIVRTQDKGIDFAATALADLPIELDITDRCLFDMIQPYFGDTTGALEKMKAARPKVTKL